MCEAYQGNLFYENRHVIDFADETTKYVIGFLEVETNWLLCGKPLKDNPIAETPKGFFDQLGSYRESLKYKEQGENAFFDESDYFCDECFKKTLDS